MDQEVIDYIFNEIASSLTDMYGDQFNANFRYNEHVQAGFISTGVNARNCRDKKIWLGLSNDNQEFVPLLVETGCPSWMKLTL